MNTAMPQGWLWLRRVTAVGAMCLGGSFVLGLIAVMNAAEARQDPPPAKHGPVIAMQRAPKPPPKPRPKPRKRKAKTVKRSVAPPPNLAAGLSGVDLGLPGLGEVDLSSKADILGNSKAIGDTVMTSDTVDVLPKPLQTIQPSYPSRARAKGVTGFVKLSLQIGARGEVLAVRVAQSEPPGVFDQAAVEAIRRWRFSPATFKGQPVKVWVTQRLNFKLS